LGIYCGIDWSEQHRDVALVDEAAAVVARKRIDESVAGFGEMCTFLATHADDPVSSVPIAIETDRGLLVAALRGTGYRIYSINPKAVDRYRDRHRVSGAKSDARDAQVLADIVRTDIDHHRPLPADSESVQAIGMMARAHQDALRLQARETNRLRSLLREYFPAAVEAFRDLRTHSALAVLEHALTPAATAQVDRADLRQLLPAAGRRGIPRVELDRLLATFAAPQTAPASVGGEGDGPGGARHHPRTASDSRRCGRARNDPRP
jgi:transposase